jgi:endonuclease III
MPSSDISRFFQPRSQNEKDKSINNINNNPKKRPLIHAKNEAERQEVIVIDSDDEDDNVPTGTPPRNENDTVVDKNQEMNKPAALPSSTVYHDVDTTSTTPFTGDPTPDASTALPDTEIHQRETPPKGDESCEASNPLASSLSSSSTTQTIPASNPFANNNPKKRSLIHANNETDRRQDVIVIDSDDDDDDVPTGTPPINENDTVVDRNQETNKPTALPSSTVYRDVDATGATPFTGDPASDASTALPDAKRHQQETLLGDESLSSTIQTIPAPASNPFAMFAACSSTSTGAAASVSHATLNVHWRTNRLPSKEASKPKNSTAQPFSAETLPTTTKPKSKTKTEWIKMRDLPAQEQARVVEKWHSLLQVLTDKDTTETTIHKQNDSSSNVSMTTAPVLEDCRFQLLVAARLHARCQEAAVRKALQAVQQVCRGHLSVERIAAANPDDLAAAMSNLQYYNVKAKHLVQSAQEIQTQFGGEVPEAQLQLQMLTGIGPVMGDLLAFVNTRAIHLSRTAHAAEIAALVDGNEASIGHMN